MSVRHHIAIPVNCEMIYQKYGLAIDIKACYYQHLISNNHSHQTIDFRNLLLESDYKK